MGNSEAPAVPSGQRRVSHIKLVQNNEPISHLTFLLGCMGAAVPGWGEYFAKVYLLRPKIKCNSHHSRPADFYLRLRSSTRRVSARERRPSKACPRMGRTLTKRGRERILSSSSY